MFCFAADMAMSMNHHIGAKLQLKVSDLRSYVIPVICHFAKLFVYRFIIMPELPRVPLVDERQP